MKPHVFITREIPSIGLRMIQKEFEISMWDKYYPPPKRTIIRHIKKADAIVSLLTDPIDKEVLDHAKNLKIITQYAVGYDNIDIEECTRRGIYVTNTPGVLTDAVADLTIGLILAITRRIIEADNFVRSGEWEKTRTGWHPMMMLGVELKGKILGIVGMGLIGQAVARRAKAFGMQIVYYSKTRKPQIEKELNAKFVDLEELLKISDVVSLHVPLTKETFKLIGEKELRMMKPTAYLINTARGKVVDEEALYRALKEGWIAGAALDVFWNEPIEVSHPLLSLKNVIVAPHMGSATKETREKMAVLVAENLIAFKRGEIPPNLVNKDVINVRKPGFDKY